MTFEKVHTHTLVMFRHIIWKSDNFTENFWTTEAHEQILTIYDINSQFLAERI